MSAKEKVTHENGGVESGDPFPTPQKGGWKLDLGSTATVGRGRKGVSQERENGR